MTGIVCFPGDGRAGSRTVNVIIGGKDTSRPARGKRVSGARRALEGNCRQKKPTRPRRLVQLKWFQHTEYVDFSPINTSGSTHSNAPGVTSLPNNRKITALSETNCKNCPKVINISPAKAGISGELPITGTSTSSLCYRRRPTTLRIWPLGQRRGTDIQRQDVGIAGLLRGGQAVLLPGWRKPGAGRHHDNPWRNAIA